MVLFLKRIFWAVIVPVLFVFVSWKGACYWFQTSHPLLLGYWSSDIEGRHPGTPLLLDNRLSTPLKIGDEVAIYLVNTLPIPLVHTVIEVNQTGNGYLTKGTGRIDDRNSIYDRVFPGKQWLERHEIIGKVYWSIECAAFLNEVIQGFGPVLSYSLFFVYLILVLPRPKKVAKHGLVPSKVF
mmetsp:Transcript_36520/g.51626  ORF Transcript_36520/g.51626 Transcript_36520/m.51626 type:complete len:182 (+) Transcript_36520:2379-2924(+)